MWDCPHVAGIHTKNVIWTTPLSISCRQWRQLKDQAKHWDISLVAPVTVVPPHFFLPVFPSPRLEHYYKNIGSSSHENASPAVLSRQTESRNGEVSARFLRMNGDMWNWIHVVRPFVGTASSYNLGARASWKNIWNTCTVTSSRRLIYRLAADLMIMINQINTTGHVICLYWEAWAMLSWWDTK